jgi:hypothetical protein
MAHPSLNVAASADSATDVAAGLDSGLLLHLRSARALEHARPVISVERTAAGLASLEG